MDEEILKQIVRAALDGTKPPELSKQEMDVYIRAMFVRGITAVAAYSNRNGTSTLAKAAITKRSAGIDAEIEKILNS
jgi:hypothetical protein